MGSGSEAYRRKVIFQEKQGLSVICPSCGKENDPSAPQCWGCGKNPHDVAPALQREFRQEPEFSDAPPNIRKATSDAMTRSRYMDLMNKAEEAVDSHKKFLKDHEVDLYLDVFKLLWRMK